MTLEEAYQRLGECFIEIKNALKLQKLKENQLLVMEALSLAKPTSVGAAGSIADIVSKGYVDGFMAHRILTSRFKPWENDKCDDSWGIPPTEDAEQELNRRNAANEDFKKLKAEVFRGRSWEHVSNGSVIDAICSMAGCVSYHEAQLRLCDYVPESVLTIAESVGENIHEALASIVLSANMNCGKVEISKFHECKGVFYCSYNIAVGSTSILFKKVKL